MKAMTSGYLTGPVGRRMPPAQARTWKCGPGGWLAPRRWQGLIMLGCFLPVVGCFSPRSYPMRPERLVHPTPTQLSTANGWHLTTRDWVAAVEDPIKVKLPVSTRNALHTGKLLDKEGTPLNIYDYYGIKPKRLDSLIWNTDGIAKSAQLAGLPAGTAPTPPWPGFVEVRVTVCDGARLHARLGKPDPANEIKGSYVVITHGLFGSLEGVGMANHVQALRRAGHHVLAIEMRGHGQLNERSSELPITFGLREAADLLAAARWLKTKHQAERVGLVAFSVSGFEALLAAWLDAAPLTPADAVRPILRYVPTPAAEPAFNGGMFIISAPVGIQTVSQVFERRWLQLESPVKYTFQHRVDDRLQKFGDRPPRDIWGFIMAELRRDEWPEAYRTEAELRADMEWFLDLQSKNWAVGARRMNAVRNPILVLSAANDPLGTAQDVVELFSRANNPNIGVILLNGGGHMGFAALSTDYYYSLMTAFFNPATAPRRVDRAGRSGMP